MQNYSLYLVTPESDLTPSIFVQKIIEAVAGGVSIVQLRDKKSSDDAFYEKALLLKKRLDPLNIPLIINDRVSIAKAVNANGVHLGQSDMHPNEARKQLKKGAIIGLSLETLSDAQASLGMDVDYFAASPVFQTKTKQDASAPLGLDGLRELRRIISKPLIAIGGICETNIENVLKAGVEGVAVVSAIMDTPSPKAAASLLREKIKKYSSHLPINSLR